MKLIKNSIKKKALEYLLEKQGSKGKEIKYEELKMAEYLTPTEDKLTIEDQRNIFAIRNRMVRIETNFKNNIEDMKHIYNCENNGKKETNITIFFEEIFKNDIKKQLKFSKQFFKNLEKRENMKSSENINVPHVIHLCDPLPSSNEVAMDCK